VFLALIGESVFSSIEIELYMLPSLDSMEIQSPYGHYQEGIKQWKEYLLERDMNCLDESATSFLSALVGLERTLEDQVNQFTANNVLPWMIADMLSKMKDSYQHIRMIHGLACLRPRMLETAEKAEHNRLRYVNILSCDKPN
jgi:hypothetical protein